MHYGVMNLGLVIQFHSAKMNPQKYFFTGEMMKLLLLVLSLVGYAGLAQANSGRILDISGCRDILTVDSGNSAKLGYAMAFDSCDCRYAPMNAGYCYGSVQMGGGACQWGLTEWGSTITGNTCCYDASTMCRQSEMETQLTVESQNSEESELQEVFELQSSTYWGYLNQANRSPSSGRTVAAEAKMDACLGHGSVDTIKSLASFQQLSTCRGSSYCGDSLKNQYCTTVQANGETICQDRCDCIFSGSCNGY